MKLNNSASRIAFIMLIGTSCAGFLLRMLSADQFMSIVMSGVGAYFVAKGQESNVKTPPSA